MTVGRGEGEGTAVARNWEEWLATAAGPASPTEEAERDATQKRIQEAIRNSPLPRSVRVFAKGSYANGTNIRRDSDVDIAVEWTQEFKVNTWGETEGMTADQLGYTPVSEMISAAEFRSIVEKAIVDAFGTAVDTSGDKAIHVIRGGDRLDADIVPCFNLHRYDTANPVTYQEGQRIFGKNSGYANYADNFPTQNYTNGVAKNSLTGGRYKQIVRCLKSIEGELADEGRLPREYPGYLVECLLYNVPNDRYGGTRRFDDLDGALVWLWEALGDQSQVNEIVEVSELLTLFRGRSDRIPQNARNFAYEAWNRLHDNS